MRETRARRFVAELTPKRVWWLTFMMTSNRDRADKAQAWAQLREMESNGKAT